MPTQSSDDTAELSHLARNLRFWRKDRDWTQGDCAKKVGVHLTFISRLENDHAVPTLDDGRRLARVFGTSVDALDQPRPEPSSDEHQAALAASQVACLRGRPLRVITRCLPALARRQLVTLRFGASVSPPPLDLDELLAMRQAQRTGPSH